MSMMIVIITTPKLLSDHVVCMNMASWIQEAE